MPELYRLPAMNENVEIDDVIIKMMPERPGIFTLGQIIQFSQRC